MKKVTRPTVWPENLAVCLVDTKLQSAKFFCVHLRMVMLYHTVKFKSDKLNMLLRAKSPNLMTANISIYTIASYLEASNKFNPLKTV